MTILLLAAKLNAAFIVFLLPNTVKEKRTECLLKMARQIFCSLAQEGREIPVDMELFSTGTKVFKCWHVLKKSIEGCWGVVVVSLIRPSVFANWCLIRLMLLPSHRAWTAGTIPFLMILFQRDVSLESHFPGL